LQCPNSYSPQPTTHTTTQSTDSPTTQPSPASNIPAHPLFATHQVLTQIQEEEALHLIAPLRYSYSIPDLTIIYDIIRHMRSNATPGPDGLNGAFYKVAWPWAKK
jgi:hypothetical protein